MGSFCSRRVMSRPVYGFIKAWAFCIQGTSLSLTTRGSEATSFCSFWDRILRFSRMRSKITGSSSRRRSSCLYICLYPLLFSLTEREEKVVLLLFFLVFGHNNNLAVLPGPYTLGNYIGVIAQGHVDNTPLVGWHRLQGYCPFAHFHLLR